MDYIDYAAYRAAGGYRLLQQCFAGMHDAHALILALEHGDLRRFGGIGFHAQRAWPVRRSETQPRRMVINVDEDLAWLRRDPHRFLEALLITAWVVGALQIHLGLREEERDCIDMLGCEIDSVQLELPIARLPGIVVGRPLPDDSWPILKASARGA